VAIYSNYPFSVRLVFSFIDWTDFTSFLYSTSKGFHLFVFFRHFSKHRILCIVEIHIFCHHLKNHQHLAIAVITRTYTLLSHLVLVVVAFSIVIVVMVGSNTIIIIRLHTFCLRVGVRSSPFQEHLYTMSHNRIGSMGL
jgi:hypothetical protein